MALLGFPDELLFQIACELDSPKDIAAFSRTARRCWFLVQDYRIWKYLLERRWPRRAALVQLHKDTLTAKRTRSTALSTWQQHLKLYETAHLKCGDIVKATTGKFSTRPLYTSMCLLDDPANIPLCEPGGCSLLVAAKTNLPVASIMRTEGNCIALHHLHWPGDWPHYTHGKFSLHKNLLGWALTHKVSIWNLAQLAVGKRKTTQPAWTYTPNQTPCYHIDIAADGTKALVLTALATPSVHDLQTGKTLGSIIPAVNQMNGSEKQHLCVIPAYPEIVIADLPLHGRIIVDLRTMRVEETFPELEQGPMQADPFTDLLSVYMPADIITAPHLMSLAEMRAHHRRYGHLPRPFRVNRYPHKVITDFDCRESVVATHEKILIYKHCNVKGATQIGTLAMGHWTTEFVFSPREERWYMFGYEGLEVFSRDPDYTGKVYNLRKPPTTEPKDEWPEY